MSGACVVFSTPGLIPLESFQTFGVNAKPNSTNPFGIFGTGLKIAIAVCLRFEQEVVLWRGVHRYTFYTKATDFRGKTFDYVRMKEEKWSIGGLFGRPKYTQLPFTTELGKNWELWQAFREFETNTRDEQGYTVADDGSMGPLDDTTRLIVLGSRMMDEFHDMDRNFLPDGQVVREDEAIQVIARPSRHVYYRGVRVMDLKEEAAYTYNFLKHVELTEDRTAKYPFMLESALVDLIAESEDEDFVEDVVTSKGYESSLYYGYRTTVPGSVFISVVQDSNKASPSAMQLVSSTQPQVPSTTTISITVPKASVTDEEMERLSNMLKEVFGEGIKVRNLNTGKTGDDNDDVIF